MAYFLLEGGAEFGGHMSEPDLRAMELVGGLQASIAILPTAAAPDHNRFKSRKKRSAMVRSCWASHTSTWCRFPIN